MSEREMIDFSFKKFIKSDPDESSTCMLTLQLGG